MTLNTYLLAQATVAVTAAVPAGMSTGEWVAFATLLLVAAGVIYKAGGASQKATNVEALVNTTLEELKGQMTKLLDETQKSRVADASWKADVVARVRVLEGDSPVHIHQRANDR